MPATPHDHGTRRLLTLPAKLACTIGLVLAAACSMAGAQVGLARLQAGTMPLALVYPTAAPNSAIAFGPVTLQVALDAAPLPGPHRLVLLSHGTGGSWVSDHALAATLARAGFVVAQPLHQGDNFRDASRAGPDAWITRPQELRQVLDMLATHPDWQGRLKLDKVGVHGMSAGGGTALVMAGAQWRLLDLVQHCLAHGDADLGFCYNGMPDTAAQAPRRAQFEQARGVPEQYLPAALLALHGGRTPQPGADEPRPDARVASVSVSVPVAAMFSSASLARIHVPVGVVSAGRDTMLTPAWHADRLLRDCPACQLLAHLPGAGHLDLLAPFPQAIAQPEATRHPRGGQLEAGFDPTTRDAAFAAIAAFHRRNLGD